MVIRTLEIHWFNARTCWRHIFPRQFTVVVMQVPPSICGSAQRMFIFADVENLVDSSSVGVITH